MSIQPASYESQTFDIPTMTDTIILSTSRDLEKLTRRLRRCPTATTSVETLAVDILHDVLQSLTDTASNELASACQANLSVKNLLIRTHNMDESMDDGTMSIVLLDVLGRLPLLQEADINLQGFDSEQFNSVVGPAVTCFVQQAKNLNKLCLRYIRIGGHEAQKTLQDWGEAFARLLSLNEFTFTQCSLDPDLAFQSLFDPVLVALSQLPSLTSLCLIERQAHQLFSTSAFLALTGTSTLRELSCYRWQLPILHELAELNHRNPDTTLQKLVLDFKGDPQSYHDVAAILSGCTALVSLELRHDWRLHMPPTTDEGGMIAVAKALRSTRLLQCLIFPFNGEPCSEPILEAFADALQVNCTLQDLKLSGCNRTWGIAVQEGKKPTRVVLLVAKILFFLYLNKKGRGEILHETSVAKWIQKLEQHRTELSCLFYYLSSNPTLCCTIFRR